MKTKHYKCTLLSDLVINAKTATEGQQKSLDYIPGANFLGLVASKLYADVKKEDEENIANGRLTKGDSFKVFHSGNVRFGNAYILENNIQCLKVPASWFHKKGEGLPDTVMVHHHISEEQRKELTENGIQLKQARSGYFNPDTKELVKLNTTFNQKSAHDRKNRRSEEGKMFGYESLPQETKFIFEIQYSEGIDIEKIEGALTGNQRLGRSKNAQYGLVNITEHSLQGGEHNTENDTQNDDTTKSSKIVIYAKSDLCFFDEYREPTLQPTPLNLGLSEDSKIIWSDSQIRTRSYAPWNGKRRTRDADRIVIEKGSVIVAEGNFEGEKKAYVGNYNAEGLGQIIINPDFLKTKALSSDEKKTLCQEWKVPYSEKQWQVLNCSLADYDKQERVSRTIDITDDTKEKVVAFLDYKTEELQLAEQVRSIAIKFKAKHKQKYKEISNSQWGEIRSIANRPEIYEARNTNDNSTDEITIKTRLKNSISNFLSHGVASNKWKEKSRAKTLLEAIDNNFNEFREIASQQDSVARNDNELIETNMHIVVAMLANQMSKN